MLKLNIILNFGVSNMSNYLKIFKCELNFKLINYTYYQFNIGSF